MSVDAGTLIGPVENCRRSLAFDTRTGQLYGIDPVSSFLPRLDLHRGTGTVIANTDAQVSGLAGPIR